MQLEVQHHKAIFLLISGKTNKAVAEEMGIKDSVLNRWKSDPDFNEALQVAFSRVYDDAINKLTTVAMSAVEELEKIVVCVDVPLKHKLHAISLVLTHGEKVKNYQLENRLQRLEQLTLNEVVEDGYIINGKAKQN